jgi:hypothetical protein
VVQARPTAALEVRGVSAIDGDVFRALPGSARDLNVIHG